MQHHNSEFPLDVSSNKENQSEGEPLSLSDHVKGSKTVVSNYHHKWWQLVNFSVSFSHSVKQSLCQGARMRQWVVQNDSYRAIRQDWICIWMKRNPGRGTEWLTLGLFCGAQHRFQQRRRKKACLTQSWNVMLTSNTSASAPFKKFWSCCVT